MPISEASPAGIAIALAIGIGLAAATGFRVFVPLLVAGLAARWGVLPLSDGFQWLTSTGTLWALGVACVLEIGAYYIPGVDHLLDIAASPVAFIAGTVASASVMVDIPPAIMWPVAIIGGGGVAGLTKLTSAVLRAKAGIATAGLANPVVSTGETMGAAGIAVAAIAVPILCVVGVLTLLAWVVVRRARRRAIE